MLPVDERDRLDVAINSVLGWIADQWSREYSLSLEETFEELFNSKTYAELTDYSTFVYWKDPKNLYEQFQEELRPC